MDNEQEVWKDIKNYEGIYQVSNLGRVYNCRYNRFLSTPTNRKKKYVDVVLNKNGIAKSYKVHRLVAEAFIPNPNNLPFVNHKDENPSNNCVDNLEWCTNEYNLNYGNAHKKQALSRSVLTKQQILDCYKLMQSGYSMNELGSIYGAAGQTISRLLTQHNKYKYDELNDFKIDYSDIQRQGVFIMGKKHRKLSDEQVVSAYKQYKRGTTLTELSKIYNVSTAMLSNVFNGKTEQSNVLKGVLL